MLSCKLMIHHQFSTTIRLILIILLIITILLMLFDSQQIPSLFIQYLDLQQLQSRLLLFIKLSRDHLMPVLLVQLESYHSFLSLLFLLSYYLQHFVDTLPSKEHLNPILELHLLKPMDLHLPWQFLQFQHRLYSNHLFSAKILLFR